MSVKRHAGYNLIGSLVPIALSLLTVPLYLKLVGPDRYGVLAIAWILLGYFGLFDMGLGRATSFRIASLREAPREARAAALWSALCVNVGMGVAGGFVLWGVAGFFFQNVLKTPDALRPEIMAGVPLLATAVPIATLTGVLSGALQGREKFLETNAISVVSTALFQLLPLSVAYFHGPDLPFLLAAAIGARLAAIVALGYRAHAELLKGLRPRFEKAEIPQLLKFGGWANLTSIIGPVLIIADRFAIGGVLGSAALAIYTVPFQLAQRIAIVPGALVNALFPRMTASDPQRRDVLARRSTQTLACIVSPIVLVGVLLLEPFLGIWVGPEIGGQAAPAGRLLFLGYWANAFALVPFIFLQASGRPDLPPKMHLIEIPIYLGCLYWAMSHMGLIGCAMVFAGRCMLDYVLLAAVSGRRFHNPVLLAFNLFLLLAALVLCEHLDVRDLAWWVGAASLVGASAATSWMNLPSDLKHSAVARARAILAARH
ncbi:flippase [Phenylobacterium sp.]|uniref:flippase n=1 Tax=Phenylobacterium sp. TaxID=1871053 RepID=UPI00301C7354